MSQGFTIDHVTPAGRLLTVFSAPDYPQFQASHSMCPDSWGKMRMESPAAPVAEACNRRLFHRMR